MENDQDIDIAQPSFISRRRWLQIGSLSFISAAGVGYYYQHNPYRPTLRFDGRYAYAGPELPPLVHSIVRYANEIQGRPYERGGGHQFLFDNAFDCSGAISHILYRAGLLTGPLTSEGVRWTPFFGQDCVKLSYGSHDWEWGLVRGSGGLCKAFCSAF